MYRCNKSIICGLFLGLTLHASADVDIKPEDENQTGRNRPLSQEFRKFERDDLRGITAESLAKMSFEDPLLRHAYIDVFLRYMIDSNTPEREETVVLEDMRSRGNSITPLLLELARENQDSIFESALLDQIAQVGNIDLEPYLQYARTLLRERTQTMNFVLAQPASMLLANHGSKSDLVLLEQVIAERPFTARDVTESLEFFKRRLERAKQATRPLLRGDPSAKEAATGNVAEKSTKQSVASRDGSVPTKSWMIWAPFGMIIAAILIWRWKSQSTSLKPPSGPI
jgi:hypothetical protein